MSDRDWDRFCEYLDKIAALPGSWQDKAAVLKAEVEERGTTTNLEEIANWINSES